MTLEESGGRGLTNKEPQSPPSRQITSELQTVYTEPFVYFKVPTMACPMGLPAVWTRVILE
jgi:hypothetical protein